MTKQAETNEIIEAKGEGESKELDLKQIIAQNINNKTVDLYFKILNGMPIHFTFTFF